MSTVDLSALGDLATELENAVEAKHPAHGCSVCKALEELPEDERMALRKAIASQVGSVRLSHILQRNGVRVGVPSIRVHRSEGHE